MTRVSYRDTDKIQEIARGLINPPIGAKTKILLPRGRSINLRISRHNNAKCLSVQDSHNKELVFFIKIGTTTIISDNESTKDRQKSLQLESFKKRIINTDLPRDQILKDLNKKPDRKIAGVVSSSKAKVNKVFSKNGIKPLEEDTSSRYTRLSGGLNIVTPQKKLTRPKRELPLTPLEKMALVKDSYLRSAQKIEDIRKKYPNTPSSTQDKRSGAITPPENEEQMAAQEIVYTLKARQQKHNKPPSPPIETTDQPLRITQRISSWESARKRSPAPTPVSPEKTANEKLNRTLRLEDKEVQEAVRKAQERVNEWKRRRADSRDQAPNKPNIKRKSYKPRGVVTISEEHNKKHSVPHRNDKASYL